jgi:hypothetical protein
VIEDASGARVVDFAVPGGAFDRAARKGWKADAKRGRWTYVDDSATPPGGITRVAIEDRSKKVPGLVEFAVNAARTPSIRRCSRSRGSSSSIRRRPRPASARGPPSPTRQTAAGARARRSSAAERMAGAPRGGTVSDRRTARARMKAMIERYEIFPGEHCGSAAMRGLLNHYCGLALPEPAVFGLSAGLECAYLETPGLESAVGVFGRTAGLEVDLGRILGIDYREQADPDDAHAWEAVRDEVLAGRPTMLSGDILYLDYREFKVHFPAHRFVLLGFDDAAAKAFVADRIRPEVEACSYAALAKSRNPPEGISTHNLWGRFHGTEVGRSLADAARLAVRECAERMLVERAPAGGFVPGASANVALGIAGIRRFADALPTWAARPDARAVASFNARCIEKFGNGGGNFRRLYAGFLAWARALDPKLVPEEAPSLATRAADGWTAISERLAVASGEDAPPAVWGEAAALARQVANVEQALFERLAAQAG